MKMPISRVNVAPVKDCRGGILRSLVFIDAGRFNGRSESERRQCGFTLLELLVVLAILGLLIGLVAPAALRQLGSAKEKIAHQSIERLASVLDIYKLDVGTYPTTDQGLQALLVRPDGVEHWSGPYLKGEKVPQDPWGHPFSTACRASGRGMITICTRLARPASRAAPARMRKSPTTDGDVPIGVNLSFDRVAPCQHRIALRQAGADANDRGAAHPGVPGTRGLCDDPDRQRVRRSRCRPVLPSSARVAGVSAMAAATTGSAPAGSGSARQTASDAVSAPHRARASRRVPGLARRWSRTAPRAGHNRARRT